jgi:hypothetical protein
MLGTAAELVSVISSRALDCAAVERDAKHHDFQTTHLDDFLDPHASNRNRRWRARPGARRSSKKAAPIPAKARSRREVIVFDSVESRPPAAQEAAASDAGAAPLSPAASMQSPAQILVPLTVPTSLQPLWDCGFGCPRAWQLSALGFEQTRSRKS